ncbi:MAG: lipoyl(octanoyl) transferase LipB, partial [candidate division WOR-3 bacterium]|nr:lipoyl(octanoyl) transferase LipB [candidate division WOR-3 bacterium]MDW7988363.1 lipoyl(octanoyl) transferase LipB [candidate division WOR-3 bacterium]
IGIKNFVYLIEKIIIEAVAKYQIVAEVKHPLVGVFVDNKKIASIGIAVSRGVSYHGFALNVNNDLSYFNWINPCGIKTLEMTSIKKILNYEVPLHELKRIIIERFIENFQLNLLNSEVI